MVSFVTKVNPNNGNETKSGIFPLDVLKSDSISFLSKSIKIFQWPSKSKFVSFMTKVNLNDRNETKSDIFPWNIFNSHAITQTMEMKQYQTFFHGTYSNLTSFFIGYKILRISMTFIISIFQFVSTNSWKEMKWKEICANLTVLFFIHNVLLYLNDFWNLFFDKVYFKNKW